HVRAHPLAVNVKCRLRVAAQPPLRFEAPEVLQAELMDRLAVLVGAGRQPDLRTGDMKEAHLVPGRVRACLFGAHHVVRWRGDAAHQGAGRAQPSKRLQNGHRVLIPRRARQGNPSHCRLKTPTISESLLAGPEWMRGAMNESALNVN